jgi:hypothetical protein
MLTDRQILTISLSLIGIALLGLATGLVIYFVYLRPNFFYGDYVVLSLNDDSGNTWWVRNDATDMVLTSVQSEAAVLQFTPGTSGQVGQLFQGTQTSFELRHPHFAAFLTATCQARTQDPVTGFSTITGTQIAAIAANSASDLERGSALQDGGSYKLEILGIKCALDGCVLDVCDVSGCGFTVGARTSDDAAPSEPTDSTTLKTLVGCKNSDTNIEWTLTKVNTLQLYDEYQTVSDTEVWE